MRFAAIVLLVLPICILAQNPSTPSADHPFRQEILKNDHVTVYSVEIPPQQSTPKHVHDQDTLAVCISGGTMRVTVEGKAPVDRKCTPGDINLGIAPYTHTVQNTGSVPFRDVDIIFATPVGAQEKPAMKKSHYCTPGSKDACVTEEYLTCTARFCVEQVTMGPWSKSSRHTHDTDHMLVALTDYNLADDIAGRDIINRRVRAGGVEYIPAGITHTLTNTSNDTVRFIAIMFR